ncbi:uroporphyrinogen-III synthase [Pseudooceanicola sp. MF1-13]|uniref:uroporphyrinogen-III synthase n=1 Tax=Pseudooceanicola sp. MF1-13 TaxID=3379095 RepID=UPI0038925E4F
MTRPAPDGATTADALMQALGVRVILSPLLEIRMAAKLPQIDPRARLIFTSRNGVRAYAALGGPAQPAICVGDATAALAQENGLDAQSAGGDADALVDFILSQPGDDPLVHLRGQNARGDVAKRLRDAGRDVSDAVIYEQALTDLSAQAIAALKGDDPVIVPLYSPRTATQFAARCPDGAEPHIIAISEAAALAAAPLRAKSLSISDTPDAAAMVRAIAATLQQLEGQDTPD